MEEEKFNEEFSDNEREKIKNEFSRLNDFVYLDAAGSMLYGESQIREVGDVLAKGFFCNPHTSKTTDNVIDSVRFRVLKFLNADPEDYSVIFTSGATAALKIVGETFQFSENSAFFYLTDSHTSVLGLREIVQTDKIIPVSKGELLDKEFKLPCPGLICFPAQCNFNGFKFPLDLVKKFQESLREFEGNDFSGGKFSGNDEKLKKNCGSYKEKDEKFNENREKHKNFRGNDEKINGNPENPKKSHENSEIFHENPENLGNSKIDHGKSENFNEIFENPENFNKNPENFHENLGNLENSENYVLLDAASFLSTSRLDLSVHKPDYITLSFYKIFGYPTGLGALIVSKRGAKKLVKKYYGGGTVKIALTRTNWHQKRDLIHERFEDGTLNFLSIVALQTCFNFMENLLGENFIDRVSRHVFNLGRYLYHQLKALRHHNGEPVVIFYHDTKFDESKTQGGIVNFNLRHADRSFVGFAEFSCIAALHNIVLRTGCFCNPGSCQTHLNLTNEDLMKQFNSGHICGDENDLVDGQPTGSVRVSFGYMTTKENVEKLVKMIRECYVETTNRVVHMTRDDVKKSYRKIKSKPKLKSIRIFPIKSCGPMLVENSWKINEKGLEYDREWMIVDGSNGTSLTQKNETRMCMIRPEIDLEKKILRLNFPDFPSIEIPIEMENARQREAKICETKVCGDRIQGWDCGDEVADWLCEVLSMSDLRLIRQSENREKKNGKISLSNQAQFLLINENSVKWLMEKVDDWENSEKDTENVVDRFRGNFVIEGLEPLAENEIKILKIGSMSFEVQGPCTRCQMICIDQNTGEKTTEPLRTIGKVFKGKMRFGIYLKHLNCGEGDVKCGNEIEFS